MIAHLRKINPRVNLLLFVGRARAAMIETERRRHVPILELLDLCSATSRAGIIPHHASRLTHRLAPTNGQVSYKPQAQHFWRYYFQVIQAGLFGLIKIKRNPVYLYGY